MLCRLRPWGCSLVHRPGSYWPVRYIHFSAVLPSGFLPSSAPHVEGQHHPHPPTKAGRTGAWLLEEA